MTELEEKIRPFAEDDKDLPVFSYSKIEVFKNCPLRYKLKYIDKQYTKDKTLPLEIGKLCHYILEQKGKMKVNEKTVDYDKLNDLLLNGVCIINENTKETVLDTDENTEDDKTAEENEKKQETILGIKEIKRMFFETWFSKDNATGMTYTEKMEIFQKVLYKEMEDEKWIPTYFELPFKFVWDNKVVIKGFIDRIDTYEDETGIHYKTIDYKTSKKIYSKSALPTSLQFGIYALAILNEFGQLPECSQYRFILINEEQDALTKGFEKRLIGSLSKVFQKIETAEKTKVFKPNPSPLCYWCDFCKQNPQAGQYKNSCEYFSLWQPHSKTFEVNKKWDTDTSKPVRKLVF